MKTEIQLEARDQSKSAPASIPAPGAPDVLAQCLSHALSLGGMEVSEGALVSGLPLARGRLTPTLAVRAAERAGASARLVRWALRRVPDVALPVVLLLDGVDACVLLARAEGGKALVYWPAEADEPIEVEADELSARYVGQTILLRAESEARRRFVESAVDRPKSWFWGTLARFWPAYLQIIAAAFFINMLALASPLFVMNVYDRVFPNAAVSTLWVLAAGVFTAFSFDALLKIVRSLTIDSVGRRVDVLLSSAIFEQVSNLKMTVRPEATGGMLNYLKDYEHLRDFFSSGTLVSLTDLLFVFIFIFVITIVGGPLAWPPIIAGTVILTVGLTVLSPLRAATRAAQADTARKNNIAVEAVGDLETIKSLGAEGRMQHQWERLVAGAGRSQQRVRFWSNLGMTITGLTQQLASVSIVILGVYLAMDGELTMGAVIASVILSGRVLAPLGSIAGTMVRGSYAFATLRALNRIMALPSENRPDKAYLRKLVTQGAIALEGVSFQYPGAPHPSLAEASLTIAPGERVGVIGRIGSGKTTLMRLLTGMYEPTAGAVMVDGVDARQYHPRELRRAIGVVMQDTILFSGTLRDNIGFAAPEMDDEAIVRVARIAGVDEIARSHPSGYNMPIIERGRNLSGGQRQLIALARALLLSPKFLVLDEPTSAMDAATEKLFIARLGAVLAHGGATLVVATHRSSMLTLVDRLIVLEKGRVIADGPKAEVLERLRAAAPDVAPAPVLANSQTADRVVG